MQTPHSYLPSTDRRFLILLSSKDGELASLSYPFTFGLGLPPGTHFLPSRRHRYRQRLHAHTKDVSTPTASLNLMPRKLREEILERCQSIQQRKSRWPFWWQVDCRFAARLDALGGGLQHAGKTAAIRCDSLDLGKHLLAVTLNQCLVHQQPCIKRLGNIGRVV